ncbi:biosynthetic arginine decarboxylase [Pleionea sp. CnH1-48]|uniref:biosynthetic arginine decarboxylase n=1 Tax=Pleionea sp. CnH1-48 TaxID=2954494 RepID=UPI002097EA8A|nr:biosynthetic arginine decarboxylase [Pleionea sp. CnH1-48]MCO7227074.1 biosynthetic arginine decarboxylase [Pleionea sp. CnH1-48]
MTKETRSAINNYNVPHWSDGFFNIDDDGDLIVVSNQGKQQHKLAHITEQLTQAGTPVPLLLRFGNILRERFDQINHAFQQAIEQQEYKSRYTCVYPIKVNQQRVVVDELANHGAIDFGLESGSKPELLAVLGTPMPKDSIVVCNGYKDREYIRTALIGQTMGRRVFIVIEKLNELDIVLEEAEKLNIEPTLGVRVRMYAVSKGKWQDTGGEKSKFGLSPSQLLKLTDKLKSVNKAHCLKLLHCHLGSQISSISDIHNGVKECARYYSELHRMGIPIEVVDVGGGLGVDYEGTQSHSYHSINYSIQEYANMVVQTLKDTTEQNALPCPEIITESGRALTAHHAVLIANIIDIERAPGINDPKKASEDDVPVLKNLWRHYDSVGEETAVEAYHAASYHLNEALMLYTHDSISLEDWARCEQLYFATCRSVVELLDENIVGHEEIIKELESKLADKLFCNFSLFQSLPDAWGVDQVFPVLPIHNLDKPLTRRGIIKDITCDSDGRIEQYVNGRNIESSLFIPEYDEEQPFMIGIFMVGAYQEILGDLHNLFGDTHSVHIELKENGEFVEIEHTDGDTVSEVLSIVHFEPQTLIEHYRSQLNQETLTLAQQQQYLEELQQGLVGYTYFEK